MNENDFIKNNDFLSVRIVDSELPVVIIFSSVNTKRGNFTFFNTFSDLGLNVIFVNESENSWYTHGINGMSRDVALDSVELINYARNIGNGKVYTFGSSMGGYAAALYGSVGSADGFISFGPKVNLGIAGCRSRLYMKKPFHQDYNKLLPHIKDFNKPNIIFIPENDELDLLTFKHLNDYKNLNIILLPGSSHPGFNFIRGDILKSVIQDFCLNGVYNSQSLSFDKKTMSVDFSGYSKNVVEVLYQSYLFKIENNHKDSLKELLSIPDPKLSNFYLKLGEAYNRNGYEEEALLQWNKAFDICDFQYEALANIANFHMKEGVLDLALSFIEKAIKIYPYSAKDFYTQALITNRLKDYYKAEYSFRKAVELNKNNLHYVKTLKKFLLKDISRKSQEIMNMYS